MWSSRGNCLIIWRGKRWRDATIQSIKKNKKKLCIGCLVINYNARALSFKNYSLSEYNRSAHKGMTGPTFESSREVIKHSLSGWRLGPSYFRPMTYAKVTRYATIHMLSREIALNTYRLLQFLTFHYRDTHPIICAVSSK